MAIFTPEAPQASSGEDSPIEKAGPIVTRENFTYQAEDIIATLGDAARKGEPRHKGIENARDAYVDNEPNEQLKKFSHMLLGARQAEIVQHNLDSLAPKIQDKTATAEERKEYYDLRDTAISYNHEVRDVIWGNPLMITRADMTKWLEMCGTGNSQWANRILQGMAAEIAVGRQIQMVPGVHEVRMSTAAEDAKGVDIVAILTDGNERHIDVKSGQQSLGYMPRRDGMEIGVDNDMLVGFVVRPEHEDEIRRVFASAAGLDSNLTERAA